MDGKYYRCKEIECLFRSVMIKNEEEIKRWFKDHVATLTKCGDIEVLDWRKSDTCIFAVRYVFDGCHMYVSGDLGEAVFRFTEKACLDRIATYSLDYFDEKMRAFCDAERDFDRGEAKKGLDYWKQNWEDEDVHVDKVYNELLAMVDDCSSVKEWECKLYDYDINKVGYDSWEWLPGVGSVIPMRVESYLIGLKMAAKQLELKGK
jgi:hypothetical protein